MFFRSTALASMLLLILGTSRSHAKADCVILGYSASWGEGGCPVSDYALGTLTHIARAFLTPHPDGSVGVPEKYFDPQLETVAHAHGIKLLMSIGGEAANADNWVSIATHPPYLDRFLSELSQLMTAHHYDGIDIDWEPAPLTFDDGKAYTSFLKSLRTKFPKATLTAALPASDYWTGHFNWSDVLANLDYVNVMTYDYSGGWGGVAAHGSNLYPPSAYPPQPEYSADAGMQNLITAHHLPPSKLLMGLTFWAYRFRANHIGDKFPANTPGYADNIPLSQVEALLRTGHYKSLWDEKAQMPYLERTDGGSVISFENPESIRRKCEYARAANCAGMMIWDLGADTCGLQTPLMDAIAQANASQPQTLSRTALENQINDLTHKLRNNPPTTQPDANKLTLNQLESLYATLQQTAGQMNDQMWHDQDPSHKTAGR